MYTVKLYQGENCYNVFETSHYNISKFKEEGQDVVEITLFQDFTTSKGTTYAVAENLQHRAHFTHVYIENSTGKTVEHYRPKANTTKRHKGPCKRYYTFLLNLVSEVKDNTGESVAEVEYTLSETLLSLVLNSANLDADMYEVKKQMLAEFSTLLGQGYTLPSNASLYKREGKLYLYA